MAGLQSTEKAARDLADAMDSASDSVEKLMESVVSGGNQFENMLRVAESTATSIKKMGDAFGEFSGAVGYGINTLGEFIGTLAQLGRVFKEGMEVTDASSAGHRLLYDELHKVGVQFGITADEARLYGLALLDVAGDVGGADFGFINSTELTATAKALGTNKVQFERFGDTIVSTAGRMDLLTAATLQAGVSGLDTGKYFNTLADAILRQGLETQDAMEQLSSFKDIADETGLSVDSIADALTRVANGFTKMGLSADFGRPLIMGFANTMKEMGLGIENAGELATSLGNSLAALSQDYSTMFVTAQRGGMTDFLGGGVLGPAIELQAQMLEAEGDPEAQARLSSQLAEGLKETIASFTGGDIITAQEARRDSGLKTQFFTQQKLLQQMYNLDDQTAARTLDLLDQLDEAISMGNTELAESLGQDLGDAISQRDRILDLTEKGNAILGAQLAEQMASNEALFFLTRETVGRAGLAELDRTSAAAFSKLEESMMSHRGFAEEAIRRAQEGEAESFGDIKTLFGTLSEGQGQMQEPGTTPLPETNVDRLISSVDSLVNRVDQLLGRASASKAAVSGPSSSESTGTVNYRANGG